MGTWHDGKENNKNKTKKKRERSLKFDSECKG